MLLLALLLLLLLVLILLVLLPLEERLVSGNMACTFSTLRCRPPHEFQCGDLRAVFGVWGSAQCTFVSVSVSVCLPVRVAAAPVNPFRSLPIDFVDSSVDLPFFAGILVIFLLFSFALLFRIRFSSYFTIYTLRLLVNSRHFRYIVFDFSNAFYAFHITHTSFNLSFSIFYLFFLLFFATLRF